MSTSPYQSKVCSPLQGRRVEEESIMVFFDLPSLHHVRTYSKHFFRSGKRQNLNGVFKTQSSNNFLLAVSPEIKCNM